MSRDFSALEAHVRERCEAGFAVGTEHTGPLAPTGEPYVVLCGTGAGDAAVAAFQTYADGRTGLLYWRIAPEIADDKFYMRLLISDRLLSESDERTANNAVRHTYRILTDTEKQQMVELKDLGALFITKCNIIGKSRELSLAITRMEEAVMWAVKHVTS